MPFPYFDLKFNFIGGGDADLSLEAERLLMEHPWPGNIRQLGHVLRTAAALADGGVITRAHLPSIADVALAPTRLAPYFTLRWRALPSAKRVSFRNPSAAHQSAKSLSLRP